ncbi:MAG: hypothetical protein Q4A64_05825 [Porphyromonadaceae bacterium]|nr:hypothetical protein [Porphyromonadaceae bacterium]
MDTKEQTHQQYGLPDAEASKKHYTTPEGYLEGLTERIMAGLPEEETTPIQPVSWWVKAKPIIYLAASFAGLYYGFKAVNSFAPQPQTEQVVQQVADAGKQVEDDYLLYLQDYGESLEDLELEVAFGENAEEFR